MNKFRLLKLILALLIIASGIFAFKYLISHKPHTEKTSITIQPPIVRVTKINKKTQNIDFELTGTVKPYDTTLIQPEVSGKIVYVSPNFFNGKIVKKGEILLKIEDIDYKVALKKAENFYKKSLLEYEKIKEKAKRAIEEWQNIKKRLRLNKPSPLRLYKPQLSYAKSLIDYAKSEVNLAKKNLKRTILKAPFTGIISQKADIGIGTILSKGKIIGKLLNIKKVEIVSPIPDYDYPFIDLKNKNVEIVCKLKDNIYKFSGTLDRSSNIIDEKTRMINIYSIVINPYKQLKDKIPLFFGTFVTVKFKGKMFKNIAKIPVTAIHNENEIWLIKDNKLTIKKVHIIKLQKNHAFITGDFKNNSLLITTNLPYVSEGMKIRYSN